MLKAVTLPICAALLLGAALHGAKSADSATPSAAAFTPVPTPQSDFESHRIKGLNIALPGPQDTIDPDFAGLRSSLAALGIGYIGWSSNSFYNNMLPAERTTFGQQAFEILSMREVIAPY